MSDYAKVLLRDRIPAILEATGYVNPALREACRAGANAIEKQERQGVSGTQHLDRLDALLYSRPAGRNIIDYAIEEIIRLRGILIHFTEENERLRAELAEVRHFHTNENIDRHAAEAEVEQLRGKVERLKKSGRKLRLRAWCHRYNEPSRAVNSNGVECRCDVCNVARAWDEELG